MNKKLQKGIVAAVAATLGTGIVAPVYAASAETTDLASKYAKAYEATVSAKTQKELTTARTLVDALYAEVKGTANEYLATTLSSLLDPLQQVELVKLDNAIKAAAVSGKQADVNAARALIVDMPVVWRNAFSSYMDGIQQPIINKAVAALDKAKASGLKADYDAALVLFNELLTVTNNDGVKAWVETALKAEVDAVAKLDVVSVNATSNITAVVTFSNEVEAVDATNFAANNGVSVVKAEVNASNKKEVKLTFNTTLTDEETYDITIQGVKNLLGSTIEEGKKASFTYEVADVVKVELTKTSFLPGADLNDSVKITDKLGRNVTAELAETYPDYTIVISSTSANIVDGVVDANLGANESAYVEVKVMDGDTVVATTEAVKVSLYTLKAESFVGFTFGDAVLTTDEYETAVKDEEVKTSLKAADSGSFLTVVVKNLGENLALTAEQIDKVENLTPTVANVDPTDLSVNVVSTGTAKVRITAGDLVQTITFDVKANSKLTTAALDKTSVTLNSKDGAALATSATVNVSLLDQYSEKFVATAVTQADAGNFTTDVNNAAGTKIGTLTVKSSKPAVATVELNDEAASDDSKIPVKINVAGTGTSTVTIELKNTSGTVILSKTVAVTAKEFGAFTGYKVEASATAIDADVDVEGKEDNDDSVEFTVYTVDAAGNKLETVEGATFAVQGYAANDLDIENYINLKDGNGNVLQVVPDSNAALELTASGTLKVDAFVNDVKVGTLSVAYSNTDPVATKASVNTANVLVDYSNNDGALSLNDFIFGKYDSENEKYVFTGALTIVDQFGKTVKYDPATSVMTLSTGDVVTVEPVVTNLVNVSVSGDGAVTLTEGKASGSFTLVIPAVDTEHNSDLLAAPVAINVTIVR